MNRALTATDVAEELAKANEQGGLDLTKNPELPTLLRWLEFYWPALALIVESRLHAGTGAVLVIHDSEDVLLCERGSMRVLRSWRVDTETAKALRPLAEVWRGRRAAAGG